MLQTLTIVLITIAMMKNLMTLMTQILLLDNEIMQISLENDSNIGLNKNDAQNIENNSNADHLVNNLARKPQDELQSYAQNIENNPNADNLIC